jgi:hypothetical protein
MSTNVRQIYSIVRVMDIGNFPKTLLLSIGYSWAKIQYARDGERPDL